jgi:membrane fusion protein, multidrug efflux system
MMSLSSSSRVALIAAVFAACSQSKDAAAPREVSAPIEIVSTAAIPEVRVTTGTVRSTTVSSLSSKVVGNVMRVLVSEGDRVRAGQLLVEIDNREMRARNEQAHAVSRGVDAAIASAAATVAGAEANANFADATYKRFAMLRERGSVSPHEFEEVAARQKGAQAELERARRSRDQLLAQRAQSLAGVTEAETFLSYARITSPIDGVVTARLVDPGAQASPGVPLVTVEDTRSRRVETTIDEDLAATVRTGDNVTVDGAAARISHIASIDPSTRSALVKIDLPSDTSLRSGTFVHVAFATGTRDSVTIPAAAIARSGQLTSVFIVDPQMAARMRLVTLGDAHGDRVEVLSGLEAGERIISTAAGMRDGVQVKGTS